MLRIMYALRGDRLSTAHIYFGYNYPVAGRRSIVLSSMRQRAADANNLGNGLSIPR